MSLFNRLWRKDHPSPKIRKLRVMRQYAKEAAEMSREELEQEYIKLQFARTVFSSFSIPKGFWDDVDEDEDY